MEWYELTNQKPPKVMDVLNPFTLLETENPDNHNYDHQRRNYQQQQQVNTDLKRRIEFVLSSSDYYYNTNSNSKNENDKIYTHPKIHPSFPYHEPSIPDQHYYSTDDYFFYPRKQHNDSMSYNDNPIQQEYVRTSLTPSFITQDNNTSSTYTTTTTNNDHNLFPSSPQTINDQNINTQMTYTNNTNESESHIQYYGQSMNHQRQPYQQKTTQSILAQNPETGDLYSKSPVVTKQNTNNASSWTHLTNIGPYPTAVSNNDEGQTNNNNNNKKKKKSTTKKKKTKKKKISKKDNNKNNDNNKQKSSLSSPSVQKEKEMNNDIDTSSLLTQNNDSIIPNTWNIMMDSQNNTHQINNDDNRNTTSDNGKKRRQKLSTSHAKLVNSEKRKRRMMEKKNNNLQQQQQQYRNVQEMDEDIFKILEEQYGFKNAGMSTESLEVFYNYIKDIGMVTWSIIFYDNNCTTPFIPFTKKYCTEKTSASCQHWNCIADNHVRATQASKPLIGAMFILSTNHNNENEPEFECFLLPLGRTRNKFIDISRMVKWPIIPIQSSASARECWDVFRKILCDKDIVCVTYNATVGLMPYHYHCSHDFNEDSYQSSSVQALEPRNIWDLKLASWMLSPHAPEETLEFDTKCDGFAHLRPKHHNCRKSMIIGQEESSQLKGLVEIQRKLEFLSIIYPIIQNSLKTQNLISSFEDIESPVLSLLSAMECHGIRLKSDDLHQAEAELQIEIDNLSKEARSITNNNDLLLSSSKQIQELLFDQMKIPFPTNGIKQKTRSSSEEVLLAIQNQVEKNNQPRFKIIDIILDFRKRNKMITGFLRPLPYFTRKATLAIHGTKRRSKKRQTITAENGNNIVRMIHPMWMQTAVRTGRLSCRKPNMQQIPNSGEMKTKLRSAFIPSSSKCCFVSCDYSQNEVRILAHVSNDQNLIQMFHDKKGIDIYKQMASLVTGIEVDNVTNEQRSTYKQVTLAIIYGMGITQVAQKLGIDRQAAQDLYNSFYRRFPRVKRWIDETKIFAYRHKYVKTIYGRKRYLDDIDSHDTAKKSQAERQAVNTIIQGSAADLMKLAMLKMASRVADWKRETTGNNTDKSLTPKML